MDAFTLDQWLVVLLAFLLGLFLGMSFLAGGKWKRRYREESRLRAEEARLRAAGAAASMTLRRLCRPNSIFRLTGSAQGAAYAWSSGAAEAIVAQHGTEALFELYDAFNDPELDAQGCAATTDRVMRRTIDMSLAELEAAVAGG